MIHVSDGYRSIECQPVRGVPVPPLFDRCRLRPLQRSRDRRIMLREHLGAGCWPSEPRTRAAPAPGHGARRSRGYPLARRGIMHCASGSNSVGRVSASQADRLPASRSTGRRPTHKVSRMGPVRAVGATERGTADGPVPRTRSPRCVGRTSQMQLPGALAGMSPGWPSGTGSGPRVILLVSTVRTPLATLLAKRSMLRGAGPSSWILMPSRS